MSYAVGPLCWFAGGMGNGNTARIGWLIFAPRPRRRDRSGPSLRALFHAAAIRRSNQNHFEVVYGVHTGVATLVSA